ncbi:hypothetical protein MMC17_009276 [Xylographa soralifera]|nr:hypothetical protein [Xylographa soralifera]
MILSTLVHASSVSPLKAFFFGQSYEKKLEEQLRGVLVATEAVKAEATLCLHEANTEGLAIRPKAPPKLESVDEKINYLTNTLDAARRQLRRSQFLDPLTNIPQSQGLVQGGNISRSLSPMTAIKRADMKVAWCLDFRREDAQDDLIDRLQLTYPMPLSQQGRAVDLTSSDNLKGWFKIMSSDVLLVHRGSADEDTEELLSLVSAVACIEM